MDDFHRLLVLSLSGHMSDPRAILRVARELATGCGAPVPERPASASAAAPDPPVMSIGDLTPRDLHVWEALHALRMSFPRGISAANCKRVCKMEGIGSRKVWESSAARLLLHGRLTRIGNRYFTVEGASPSLPQEYPSAT